MTDFVSVRGQLKQLNKVLSRLQKAANSIEVIQSMMHVRPHSEEDKKARLYRRMLKKTGENNWLKKDRKLFSCYRSLVSYKTFEVRSSKNNSDKTTDSYQFRGLVGDAVKAIEACHAVFKPGSIRFDGKGSFDRSHSISWVEHVVSSRIQEVTSYMDEVKKSFNQSHHVHYTATNSRSALDVVSGPKKYTYLVELRSSFNQIDHGFDFFSEGPKSLSKWIKQLRHTATINQRYLELLKEKNQRIFEAECALFDEIVQSYKAMNDEAMRWTSKEVMNAIHKEIADGRRVYIKLSLNNKKDKYREHSISMWTALFSSFATLGESITGAFNVAAVLTGATGSAVISAAASNPAVIVATVASFLAVLVVNQSLFDKQIKDLFKMIFKGDLFKNKDGSLKSKTEIGLLSVGGIIAIISGIAMAVLAYNYCLQTLTALIPQPELLGFVTGIAVLIGVIELIAMTGFNFQFFNSMFSNLGDFKKTMNRLYFQGRSKVAKGFLFALNLVLTTMFLVSSLIIGKKNLSDFFSSFGLGLDGVNWGVQGISAAYYLSGSVAVINSMIMAFRVKLSAASRFFKEATASEIVARICIDIFVGIPKQVAFFVATCALASFRMALNLVKIAAAIVVNASFVTGLPLLVTGIHALLHGKRYSDVLKTYSSSPQRLINEINDRLPKWNWLYRECYDKSGALPIAANAGANAAICLASTESVKAGSSVAASTMLDVTSIPGATMKSTVSYFCNTEAKKEGIRSGSVKDSISAGSEPTTGENRKVKSAYCPRAYFISLFRLGQADKGVANDLCTLLDDNTCGLEKEKAA